jgi:NAD(P)-dependent dehydrogenase (short-subunit alcohol dehydrogenase family)
MMDIDLKGKVAIVTGAGRGIGRAMAIALAKAGAKVTITAAREKNELNAVIDEISRLTGRDTVHAVIADVTDESACRKIRDATLERLGGLHVLVNNAARGHKYIHDANPGAPMDFWNADTEAWKMIIDTNVNGPFLMAKAVTPHLLAQKWGRIVNIGVTPSSMQKKRNSPYGVSKAALESETLIWAQELAGTGVTCNSLSPGGATLTGMVYGKDRERAGLADPEIMGIPIVWLASEQSSWCNGQRLIAKDWNAALDPDEAARQSIAAPALTPPSTDAPATMR